MSILSRFLGEKTDVVSLLQETNSLLRELILVQSGKPALTRPVSPPQPQRVRTEKDISFASRQVVAEAEQEDRERKVAPHRFAPTNGPASAPSPSNTGQAQPATRPARQALL